MVPLRVTVALLQPTEPCGDGISCHAGWWGVVLESGTRSVPFRAGSLQILNWVYGDGHPVAQTMSQLSAARTSAATQQAIVERQRAIDIRLADAAVAAGVPDALEELPEERRADVRERVWALRNVATSLERGSRDDRNKARTYYETALALQRARFRVPFLHPGLVAELWGCALHAPRYGSRHLGRSPGRLSEIESAGMRMEQAGPRVCVQGGQGVDTGSPLAAGRRGIH